MVAPPTDALAPDAVVEQRGGIHIQNGAAEATAPPLAPNITELLTLPIPGSHLNAVAITREIVT